MKTAALILYRSMRKDVTIPESGIDKVVGLPNDGEASLDYYHRVIEPIGRIGQAVLVDRHWTKPEGWLAHWRKLQALTTLSGKDGAGSPFELRRFEVTPRDKRSFSQNVFVLTYDVANGFDSTPAKNANFTLAFQAAEAALDALGKESSPAIATLNVDVGRRGRVVCLQSGKAVVMPVPVQFGKWSQTTRRVLITDIRKDDYNGLYHVYGKIEKGQKGAGRKIQFSVLQPGVEFR